MEINHTLGSSNVTSRMQKEEQYNQELTKFVQELYNGIHDIDTKIKNNTINLYQAQKEINSLLKGNVTRDFGKCTETITKKNAIFLEIREWLGNNIMKTENDKCTLLHVFCVVDVHHDVINCLMPLSSEIINLESKQHGWTPLLLAIRYGKSELVNVLIKYKGDVNKTNKYGLSPLHLSLLGARCADGGGKDKQKAIYSSLRTAGASIISSTILTALEVDETKSYMNSLQLSEQDQKDIYFDVKKAAALELSDAIDLFQKEPIKSANHPLIKLLDELGKTGQMSDVINLKLEDNTTVFTKACMVFRALCVENKPTKIFFNGVLKKLILYGAHATEVDIIENMCLPALSSEYYSSQPDLLEEAEEDIVSIKKWLPDYDYSSSFNINNPKNKELIKYMRTAQAKNIKDFFDGKLKDNFLKNGIPKFCTSDQKPLLEYCRKLLEYKENIEKEQQASKNDRIINYI